MDLQNVDILLYHNRGFDVVEKYGEGLTQFLALLEDIAKIDIYRLFRPKVPS